MLSLGDITYIPKELIDDCWHQVKDLLYEAVKEGNGEFDLDDVKQELMEGSALLWIVGDIQAVVVTKICKYKKKTSLFIQLLAGKYFDQWAKCEPVLVEYAKTNNCQCIESFVIPGVSKLTRKLLPEYRVTHHVMVKDIYE